MNPTKTFVTPRALTMGFELCYPEGFVNNVLKRLSEPWF